MKRSMGTPIDGSSMAYGRVRIRRLTVSGGTQRQSGPTAAARRPALPSRPREPARGTPPGSGLSLPPAPSSAIPATDRACSSGDTPLRTTTRPAGRAASAQRRRRASRLAIGPVAQHVLEQIEIGAGGQRVEEALTHRGDTIGHAGRLEDLGGSSHRRVGDRPACPAPWAGRGGSPPGASPSLRRRRPRCAPNPSRR